MVNTRQVTLTVPTIDLSRLWARRIPAINLATIFVLAPAVWWWVDMRVAAGMTVLALVNLLLSHGLVSAADVVGLRASAEQAYLDGRRDVVAEARMRKQVAQAKAMSGASADPYDFAAQQNARVHAQPHPQDHDEEGMRQAVPVTSGVATDTPNGRIPNDAATNGAIRTAFVACVLSCVASFPVWIAATRGFI